MRPETVALRDRIIALHAGGMRQYLIARECGCHIQTVYYWLKPERRAKILAQRKLTFKMRRLSGPKQTRAQRDEILKVYLADRAAGTALAVKRGLSPLYAYKLAHAMGALP